MPDKFFGNNVSRVKYKGMLKIIDYFEICLGNRYKPEAEYVVLWYGQIYYYRNRKSVQVYFLDCSTKRQVVIGIPIKSILKLPIGSVWVHGVCEEKYNFDTLYTVIDEYDTEYEKRSNLTYSNHFNVSKKKDSYVLNPDKYRVEGIRNDNNINLVIHTEVNRILIPSVLFFVAHYGVSKEINKVLVSFHRKEVELRLNINDGNGELITIPDGCVIGDAVFLYYLKTNDYTKRVVWSLNSRMLRIDIQYLPLMVKPYHDQKIELKIKGLRVDEQTILCTEILGMSMPQGDAIEYQVDKHNSYTYSNGIRPETSSFRPIYNTIESDEIVLEAERDANNITTAVVRQRIVPIGEIRKLIKNTSLTLDDVINNCNSEIKPLFPDQPDTFADGEDSNANGNIGRIQVLADNGVINSLENNFDRILRYAQDLKVSLEYAPVLIDCVNLANDDIFMGETVVSMRNNQYNTQVNSIFVIRLMTGNGVYYVFDCDKEGSQTRGIAIKVLNEDVFLEEGINKILTQLYRINGKVDNLEVIKQFGRLDYFKHTNGNSSNWVRTVIDKI